MPTPLQLTQTTTSYLGASVPPDSALTPEQIVNSLGKFFSKSTRATALDAATTGNIPAYHSPLCSGTVSGSTQNISGALAQSALVLGVKEGLGAIPVVGGALKSLAGLITLPFAHHKAAVKQEQTILCQAVPAATQMLQGVDELFQTGQIEAQTAAAALDQGLQNWLQFVKPIYMTNGALNAAYDYGQYIKAAILYRKNIYRGALASNVRSANDVFAAGNGPVIPAGSSGQLTRAATGWSTPVKATGTAPMLTQSILGGMDSSKLALAVVVLVVFGFGAFLSFASIRRIK